MTPEQLAVYVMASAARALLRMEAMKAANHERIDKGYALAYDEEAFFRVIDEECISSNAIIAYFRD